MILLCLFWFIYLVGLRLSKSSRVVVVRVSMVVERVCSKRVWCCRKWLVVIDVWKKKKKEGNGFRVSCMVK